MIRRADRGDTAELIELGSRYYREQGFAELLGAPADYASMEVMVRLYSIDKTRIMLVNEEDGLVVGVMAGGVAPIPSNLSCLCANENIAYGKGVDELREQFDVWAKSLGATASVVSCFLRSPDERMRKL